MSQTTNTEPKVEVKPVAKKAAPKATASVAKKVAPKAEDKTVAKKATPKAEEKQVATKTKVAAPKTKVTAPKKAAASNTTLTSIAEDQIDASSDTIISALNALDQQLKDARIAGSDRVQEIVKEFGGENKLTDLISTLAGYMGEAAGAGMVAGMSPMIVMAGTAKGIYRKITS